MKRSLRKSSIKYESQKWLPGVVLRRGSGPANIALSKILMMGEIVKSVVFHYDDLRTFERPIILA